jgi:hypothetical protein
MRCALLSAGVAFVLGLGARADDAADAKAIVAKAVAARGDKPATPHASATWKDAGKFVGMGITLPYTAEWSFQAPDKYRFDFVGTFGDSKISMVVVANGEKAWEKQGAKTEEMTGDKLEQTRNEAYQLWVTSLTPLLTDKGFTLAVAKGKDVDTKPTAAVKVTRDKRPAVTLYFDAASGLLVKRETTSKDQFQKWKEVSDEAYFSDYKDTNGLKHFTKLKIVRDGKVTIEATLSDAKELEKLDAKLFEKP